MRLKMSRGLLEIRLELRRLLGAKKRMSLGSTICWAMFGSGVGIFMIQLFMVTTACPTVVFGLMMSAAALPPAGGVVVQLLVLRIWVFVLRSQ